MRVRNAREPLSVAALAVGLVAALAVPGSAAAVEVLSAAHSPANPGNRFAVQCGRTGVMKVSAVVDVQGQVPTVLLGGLAARGATVVTKRKSFEDGPSCLATAKKLGGKKDQWILTDLFSFSFACRQDCSEIRVDERGFAGDTLDFRFLVGGEEPGGDPSAWAFAPRSTAETETLQVHCQDATSLPPT